MQTAVYVSAKIPIHNYNIHDRDLYSHTHTRTNTHTHTYEHVQHVNAQYWLIDGLMKKPPPRYQYTSQPSHLSALGTVLLSPIPGSHNATVIIPPHSSPQTFNVYDTSIHMHIDKNTPCDMDMSVKSMDHQVTHSSTPANPATYPH